MIDPSALPHQQGDAALLAVIVALVALALAIMILNALHRE